MQPGEGKPLVIASANGLRAVAKAMEAIQGGADGLDGVIAGVNINEEDPNDTSVGYGGLPNEDGVVELDAAVMHGRTHRAGAVAALRGIKTPSRVARLVMERTDHVLLVGDGALRFAKMHGFKEEDLLTDAARQMWLEWRANLSPNDNYLDVPGGTPMVVHPPTGTINCNAVTPQGDLSSVTTTAGVAFKVPGRVGDSSIVGAGQYCDNDVGAAGSTGLGEANVMTCGGFLTVDNMRRGMKPTDACLDALKRAVQLTEKRRLTADGKPRYQLDFYAVNKKGEYASAAVWSHSKGTKPDRARFAVADAAGARLVECAYLFQREKA